MIGWGPLRYFGHRFKLHLLWAIPVFVILVMSIGLFNWGVAHFRDLVQVNREGGFRDLWSLLQSNPFGILNFASYLMGLVGIVIAIYSAARAYTMFDAYPWYGWHYKRMKAAETEFIDKFAPIKDKVQKASVDFLGEGGERLRDVQQRRAPDAQRLRKDHQPYRRIPGERAHHRGRLQLRHQDLSGPHRAGA